MPETAFTCRCNVATHSFIPLHLHNRIGFSFSYLTSNLATKWDINIRYKKQRKDRSKFEVRDNNATIKKTVTLKLACKFHFLFRIILLSR